MASGFGYDGAERRVIPRTVSRRLGRILIDCTTSTMVLVTRIFMYQIGRQGTFELVLTYELAFEFSLGISTAARMLTDELKSGEHYRPVHVEVLPQQEAITCLPEANGFLYATEARHDQAKIYRYRCMD